MIFSILINVALLATAIFLLLRLSKANAQNVDALANLAIAEQEKTKLHDALLSEANERLQLHDEISAEANERMQLLMKLQNLHNVANSIFNKNVTLAKSGTLLQAAIPENASREEIAKAFANSEDLMNYIQVNLDNNTANLTVIKYTDLMQWFNDLVESNYEYMQMFNEEISNDENKQQ